jgi:hypothetical protein
VSDLSEEGEFYLLKPSTWTNIKHESLNQLSGRLATDTAVRKVLPRVSHAFSTFSTARMPNRISMMASC